MVWREIVSAEETEILKIPHQDKVESFFDSQGVVHIEFVPERKRLNAEFHKGIVDHLLKRIHRVRQRVFFSQDFFLLHDNAPAHKAASVCQFLAPQKCYKPVSVSVISRFISARVFSVPRVKMKLKGLPLRMLLRSKKPVTDELKEIQREEFSAVFSENVRPLKGLYICKLTYFEIK
jgi:hypothetical protein